VLSTKGWYGYVIKIKVDVQDRGIVSVNDMLFTDGDIITRELINMKTGKSLKELLLPKATKAYYTKDHLIAGDENAKNKVVIFSDPLCPACKQSLPSIINKVKINSKDIALYYYHFPLLSIHPAADTVSKAMMIAKQNGVEDIEAKVYTTDFSQYFNVRETDAKVVLDGFNKIFKTKITLDEINNAAVKNQILMDIKMGEDIMVQATPTIFVNGINDSDRSLFQGLAQ
jgi:protein-disulfide isomerase